MSTNLPTLIIFFTNILNVIFSPISNPFMVIKTFRKQFANPLAMKCATKDKTTGNCRN